jgi:hypothetical protein
MPGGTFKWGSVNIKARNVMVEDLPRQAPALRDGFAGSGDRLDVRSYDVRSLHLGLGVHIGTGQDTDPQRYKSSEGLWAHQIGKLTLPPELVEQLTLIAADFSGYRAANKNVICARSSLGGSSPVNYYALGPYLVRENSTGVLSLAHTFTNNITDIGETIANSTRYFYVITDGTTDDAVVTTDPTAGSISWSTWFALAAGDRIDWAWSMRAIGNGHTIFAGKMGGMTGFFHLPHSAALATAPKIGVNFGTKDIEGSLTIESVTAVPSQLVQVVKDNTATGLWRWERETVAGTDALPADVAASGDSLRAKAGSSASVAVGNLSTTLRALGYDFSSIWQYGNAIIKGIEYKPFLQESGSNDNVYDFEVFIYSFDQQSTAPNLALTEETGAASEWPTSSTQRTYGGSSVLHARPWTSNDLKVLQVDHCVEYAGDANAFALIDNMPVTVYYRLPGTLQNISAGSEIIGPDPVVAGRLWVIEPEGDDPTGRTVPRRLVRVDVDYDADGLRPTFTLTPQSNLPCFPYVIAGAIGEEALFLALGNDKEFARHLLTIPFNTLVPNDIEWSRDQGFTEDWGINNLFALGNDCILESVNSAATVVQDYLYESHTNSVHAYGPRETIAAIPLHHQKARNSAYSRQRHRFFPVSTTHIAAAKQYTPDTPHLDPFANLSAATKQNGPLLVTLPELSMMGPPEGRNALLTARIGSRQVSATKTVRLDYSLDGGSNWTTWATFTAYGATSTLAPPVKASTVALRIALNNAGSSVDTPSGLPLTIFGDSDFQPRRRWTLELDEEWLFREQGGAGGVEKLWDALQAVDATLHLQTVTQDGVSQGSAKWNRFRSGSIPDARSTAPAQSFADPANVNHVLVFDEVAV